MRDGTARFAAMLARSVGRFDWWNVYLEHTDFEWAMQVAMYSAEPWGESRADIRMAKNTAELMAANGLLTDEGFGEVYQGLANYLECNREPEKKISPGQAVQVLSRGMAK